MKPLITDTKVSKKVVAIGESVRVEVSTSDPKVEISINNVPGARQFVQFPAPGKRTLVITATLGKRIEQRACEIEVRVPSAEDPILPLIGSAMDRYQPRTVVFSVLTHDPARDNIRYDWDFGDGTKGVSDGPNISHDYSETLSPDTVTTQFDVRVVATNQVNGSTHEVTRSIAVFCTYAFNKLHRCVLTPRVTVMEPISLPFTNILLCLFTVRNFEDEELSLSTEMHEWLETEAETPRVTRGLKPGFLARAASETFAKVRSTIPIQHAASIAAHDNLPVLDDIDVRVPARSSVTLARIFHASQFKKPVFGVGVHLAGRGVCSKRPVIVSAYIEARLPLELGGYVLRPNYITDLAKASRYEAASGVITHKVLREVASAKSPPPPWPVESTSSEFAAAAPRAAMRQLASKGLPASAAQSPLIGAATFGAVRSLHDLLTPSYTSFSDDEAIVIDNECDPDNVPDNLPEGMVCQLTHETAWRFVPGRVLNGKKGDIVLGTGQTMIGQLLRQVSPPQYYSHSGIMSKNHIEIRSSTASPEWLATHPQGGANPTDGFSPAALKHLWPGTITQNVDQAFYTQWLNSPDGKGPFPIQSFSFEADPNNRTTLVYPVVVKPPPLDETPHVRLTLHAIAEKAKNINGHYRFYCYTNPAMALEASNVAGPESGWAQGTYPTVCTSFIWLAAQHAGVRLEGATELTSVTQLEPLDTDRGAEVDGGTHDGLYRYTEEERQAAGRWLYQTVYDAASDASWSDSGPFGKLLTDAPDDIANQLCNTFASDWADGDSKNSDAWKWPGTGNALSPDNILFWDSPAAGNQEQFRSVYGHLEELFYRPGTYKQVSIYRWKKVATRGSLTGTIVANGDVTGANVSLLGSRLPDVVVHGDGKFRFDNVPSGEYTVTAGLNINGYWNSKDESVTIDAGQTRDVTVMLEPPPEVNRKVVINVQMQTDWSSIWAHSPYPFDDTRTVHVHPFRSHARVEIEGSHSPHGKIIFDVDLNADLSVTVSWTAQEIDDGVEGTVRGGQTIAKDGSLSWSGLRVVDPDLLGDNWTEMAFQIENLFDRA